MKNFALACSFSLVLGAGALAGGPTFGNQWNVMAGNFVGERVQTGAGAASPFEYTFKSGATFEPGAPETIDAVTLRWADGGGTPRSRSMTGDTGGFFAFESGITSRAAVEDAYGSGANRYDFEITVSGFSPVTETIDGPDGALWADADPLVLNYDDLVSGDPTQDITVRFDAWNSSAANLLQTRVQIAGLNVTLSNAATEFVIPAGTLTAGQSYELLLEFSARYVEGLTLANFGGGVVQNHSYDLFTRLQFTAAPAPGAAVLLGCGLLASGSRRRR